MNFKSTALACAAALLVATAMPARAAAVVYNFNFGSAASGNFTVDGAAADAGYFLVTALRITQLGAATGLLTASGLTPGAAYNPGTGAFLNHFAGNTYDDLGSFLVEGALGTFSVEVVSSVSFSLNSDKLEVSSSTFSGRLEIVPQQGTVVPEPASLALAGTALAAAALARRKRTVTGRG